MLAAMDVMSYPTDTKTPLRVGSSWEFVTRWNKPTVLAKTQVGPITLGTFLEPSLMHGSLYPTSELLAWLVHTLPRRDALPGTSSLQGLTRYNGEISGSIYDSSSLELNPWLIGRSAVASPRVVLGQLIRDATLKRDFLLNIVGLGVSPIIRRCLKKGSMTLGTFF